MQSYAKKEAHQQGSSSKAGEEKVRPSQFVNKSEKGTIQAKLQSASKAWTISKYDKPSSAKKTDDVVQRFPFTIKHNSEPLVIVAKLEGSHIVLYSHGIEIGYLKIKLHGKTWGLKDILIHNASFKGLGLGAVLVNLFATLALANGASDLEVLLPNGTRLYEKCGFVITPNATNPENPPSVAGSVTTVIGTSSGIVRSAFTITRGLPPQGIASERGSINPSGSEEGNTSIGNDDL